MLEAFGGGHYEAMKHMMHMDYLLLLGSDQHDYALLGKVFEYIGSGKLVIAVAPRVN